MLIIILIMLEYMLEFMKSLITLKIMPAQFATLGTLNHEQMKKKLIHEIKWKYKEILASDESIFI